MSMSMYMIECSEKPIEVRDTGTYDQTVHDLVTGAPDVESIGIPFLGNLA
jgi:hypothetical protein